MIQPSEPLAQSSQDFPPLLFQEEDFEQILDQFRGTASKLEGTVVEGKVLAINNDAVLINVGLKAEGRVPLREFFTFDPGQELVPGSTVEVYLERIESKSGEAILSREKAKRREAWRQLEQAFQDSTRVTGMITGRVKGGFTVELTGASAFLPGSQVDIRPVRDISPLMGTSQPFQILKMDQSRGNIVVSRRAVLEESRTEARKRLLMSLEEGQVIQGTVKNITNYGAFVDLGGVDGLLHVTDIAWKRVHNPEEVLQIGMTVTVQVIRFNSQTQRISLGMKQLETDPWEGIAVKYPSNTRLSGRVTNLTDYGAFVELEPGVEGMVHVSEMSWSRRNVYPSSILAVGQEVEVMTLEVDQQRRRISLGLKQCLDNPWELFAESHPVGADIDSVVKNVTEFGLFIGLPGNIDGMVHMTDIDWNKNPEEALSQYSRGDRVEARVLDIDLKKGRVNLGIKQMVNDPLEKIGEAYRQGQPVTCTVSQLSEAGIEVMIEPDAKGFIHKRELSSDRLHGQERFAVGDILEAKIILYDRKTRTIQLSPRALHQEEDKQALAQYGSARSEAKFGDILPQFLTSQQLSQQLEVENSSGEQKAEPSRSDS